MSPQVYSQVSRTSSFHLANQRDVIFKDCRTELDYTREFLRPQNYKSLHRSMDVNVRSLVHQEDDEQHQD